jgi:hypothetical protein
MKNILSVILLLVSFSWAGILKADTDGQLTPDGYLGYPAFELGVNGNGGSNNFTENYSYTNYSNLETLKGLSNYSFDNIFVNVYYPVSSTFTLIAGGSLLVSAANTGSFSATANNFTGTENAATAYNYTSGYSWFVSCRIYTK